MYLYGERVRIHLPQGSVYIPPHMYDYHGTEAMVERVLFFASRRAYELFGVTSPKGKMYTFEEVLENVRRLCMDPDIVLDIKVCHSEMSNLSRNRAIAYLLESKGVIHADVEKTLDFYVKMCSLSVNAESLANLGLVLATGGLHPVTGERLLKEKTVRIVNTIMMTCGMYDGSGNFAVDVGVPAKSGVGGGIMAAIPTRMGVGIFSPSLDAKGIPTKSGVGGGLISVITDGVGIGIYGPSLDEKGNSIGGIAMLEHISEKMDFHMFGNKK